MRRMAVACGTLATVASVVWAPNYSVTSRIERGFVDGWSLSGTVTATNGTPFTGFVQSSSSQSLNGVTAPDGGMTGAEVSTFAGPTGGRASWLGRNSFNLPNYTDVDFRLGRGVSFRERYRLNFTVDAFNLFNSTIVNAVNTTAYTYSGPGTKGACSTHTNGCLLPSSSFGSISSTSSSLYGPRQLQVGARFDF